MSNWQALALFGALISVISFFFGCLSIVSVTIINHYFHAKEEHYKRLTEAGLNDEVESHIGKHFHVSLGAVVSGP